MAPGVDKTGGHQDAPASPMTGNKAEVDRLVRTIAGDIAGLEVATLERLMPALRDARNELATAFGKILAGKDGAATFTAQQYRAALVSLDAAFEKVAELQPALAAAYGYAGGAAAEMASAHLKEELARFGAIFGESIRPTQIRTAAILSRTNATLIPRFKTSAARYAGGVHDDIVHQLKIGLARGESFEQLTRRLVQLGGPKGAVALRGIKGDPGAYVEDIAEGLFRRYRSAAARVVRTEVVHAYSTDKAAAIDELNADLDEDEEPFLRRWDGAADSRICPFCRDLDSRVALPGHPFKPGGPLLPPAHPCCRCVLVPWHASWGGIKGEIPAKGEIPKAPPKPVKPKPPPPTAEPKPAAPAVDAAAPKAKTKPKPIAAPPPAQVVVTPPVEAIVKPKAKPSKPAKSEAEIAAAKAAKDAAAAAKAQAKAAKIEEAKVKADQAAAKKQAADAARAEREAKRLEREQAKERVAAAEAAASSGAVTPAMLKSKEAGSLHGVGFTADGGELENHAAKVRRVVAQDGAVYYEFSGKLTPWQQEQARKAIAAQGAEDVPLTMNARKMTTKGIKDVPGQQTIGDAYRYRAEGAVVDYGKDGATQNYFRIRVQGDDPAAAIAAYEREARRLGIATPNARPSEDDRQFAVKAKMVGKFAPERLPDGRPTTQADVRAFIEREFTKVAAQHPIAAKVLADAEWRDAGGGQRTLYSKALAEHLGNDGVRGLYHESRAPAAVIASMVENGGMSSMARFDAGIFVEGMSTSTDFRTGGADGFFTRVYRDEFRERKAGGTRSRFIIDKTELGRLDWWAYNADRFGTTKAEDQAGRWKASDIRSHDPDSGNEVMLPKGIAPGQFSKVLVAGKGNRDKVIAKLRKAGIHELNGRPLEEVIFGE